MYIKTYIYIYIYIHSIYVWVKKTGNIYISSPTTIEKHMTNTKTFVLDLKLFVLRTFWRISQQLETGTFIKKPKTDFVHHSGHPSFKSAVSSGLNKMGSSRMSELTCLVVQLWELNLKVIRLKRKLIFNCTCWQGHRVTMGYRGYPTI